MNISFQDIGTEIITVKCTSNLKPGNLCYFFSDKTCAPAGNGTSFSGKAISVAGDGTATVQIRGYIEVPYTDNLQQETVNYRGLTCNGPNDVHVDANGRSYLVVSHNLQKKVFGIIL